MKLLLVRPPSLYTVQAEVPVAVQQENISYPPLGLLYLATFLKKETRHEVAILDCQRERSDHAALAGKIASAHPDVVGISAFTYSLVDVFMAVAAAREGKAPFVLVGGPHANDFPEMALSIPGVDGVVVGEGELPLKALLDSLERGKAPEIFPGLYFRGHKNGFTPADSLSKNLDDYPVPDRTLIEFKQYYDILSGGGLYTTAMTTRGCPYRCTFCNTPRKGYRSMSPERVAKEVESLLSMGIREIYFVDDTFNVSARRVARICEEFLRKGLRFRWTCRARVRGLDEALLGLMKKAGCKRLQLGVETGTDAGLALLKKDITVAEVERAFRMARKEGIQTVAYFMLGCPGERTREDVLETVNYAIALDPDFCMFNVLTPFPGTELFEEGVRKGILKREPWDGFFLHPQKDFLPQVWEEHLSREELYHLLQIAYHRFYMRPKMVVRNLMEVRGIADLLRKGKVGLTLLRGSTRR